eukprot:TRINITY_DN32703_c0_g1_i1.p1 TRINITY_DN32703_c0_g1~~TRINITY_DN32703_c0_g1_i1.p1  ORF type:complete len:244 (+),score=26.42 TRINITY_DN32703_c0_g1_i1:75-806(+)
MGRHRQAAADVPKPLPWAPPRGGPPPPPALPSRQASARQTPLLGTTLGTPPPRQPAAAIRTPLGTPLPPGTAASHASQASRHSAAGTLMLGTPPQAASERGSQRSQRSQLSTVGELPRRWQVPTKDILEGDRVSVTSYGSMSARTPTTIREFFDEERRGGGMMPGGPIRQIPTPDAGRIPRFRAPDAPILDGRPNGPPRRNHFVTPAMAAAVLPGVPTGKIPGGRNMYMPHHPATGLTPTAVR